MKTKELRKLIGQTVWLRNPHLTDCFRQYEILEVQGRNVLVDSFGSNDWLWAPDLQRGASKTEPWTYTLS